MDHDSALLASGRVRADTADAPTPVQGHKDSPVISIYVGNLAYDTTEQQLVELFSQYGEVHRASLVSDRETGRPRGFGFVEMPNPDEAHRAIETLSGAEFIGRPLTVNEARRNTGRNTANLSRSAQQHTRDDPERRSTGYAAKPPAKPDPSPQDDEGDQDESSADDHGSNDPPQDSPGYRNDRV